MNRIDLQERSAIVTGAARGIGYAVAERLLASGAKVMLWDRDASRLAEAARTLGARAEIVDVTDPASVERATVAAEQAFGRIDALVNNAGIVGANKKAWDYSPDEWDQVLAANLKSVFLCCRAVVPRMLPRNYGRIVNIASLAGKEGNPNAAHYSASKAGVIGFTKSLGKELATTGILANAVTPTVIDTEMLSNQTPQQVDYMLGKVPMARLGRPAEAAALIAWLCSEECSFSTAAVFDLSGGRATY
ncbi:MAG: SDR family NAD(P)-dependent oxidoreductase [Gemmataceae bacterium]